MFSYQWASTGNFQATSIYLTDSVPVFSFAVFYLPSIIFLSTLLMNLPLLRCLAKLSYLSNSAETHSLSVKRSKDGFFNKGLSFNKWGWKYIIYNKLGTGRKKLKKVRYKGKNSSLFLFSIMFWLLLLLVLLVLYFFLFFLSTLFIECPSTGSLDSTEKLKMAVSCR